MRGLNKPFRRHFTSGTGVVPDIMQQNMLHVIRDPRTKHRETKSFLSIRTFQYETLLPWLSKIPQNLLKDLVNYGVVFGRCVLFLTCLFQLRRHRKQGKKKKCHRRGLIAHR